MALFDKWSRFNPERLKERSKQVVEEELKVSEDRQRLDAEKRVFESEKELNKTVVDNRIKINETKQSTQSAVLEIELEKEKAKAVAELEKKNEKLEAEAELKDSVHEDEKEHLATKAEQERQLVIIKNETAVALEHKKSVDEQVKERGLLLDYTQKNIDSLLKAKDGVIEGQNLVIASYKEQLASVNDMLRVLVAKMPDINLNNFTIKVETPPAAANKGGDNKGGGGGKPEDKK